MSEDPRIADRTRQAMQEINHCVPHVRWEECPSLFAFGPIYRAIEEEHKRHTVLVTALEALATEMDQEHADRYFAGKLKDILATHRGPR
jgi:hypothetical protein